MASTTIAPPAIDDLPAAAAAAAAGGGSSVGTRPPLKRLAVYCGSATPSDPVYMETARLVGRTLADRGITLVYGGGNIGLMGAEANAVLEAGGRAIGIIPESLVSAEVAHPGLTEIHRVDTMHQRKQAFADMSDGFLTLPGGTGTMDELWEALSWAQIGSHTKPVGLLNVAGYYDGLLQFYQKMGDVGFLRKQHRTLLKTSDSIVDLLDQMAQAEPIVSYHQMDPEDL